MSAIGKYFFKELAITLGLMVLVIFASRRVFRPRAFSRLDEELDDSLLEIYHQVRRRLNWLKAGTFVFSWLGFEALAYGVWLQTCASNPKALFHLVYLDDFGVFCFATGLFSFVWALGFSLGMQPYLVREALLPHAQRGADLMGYHRFYRDYLKTRNPKLSDQNLVLKLFHYDFYPVFAVFGWIMVFGMGYFSFTLVAGHTTFYADYFVHFGMAENTIRYSDIQKVTRHEYDSEGGPMTRIQAISKSGETLYQYSFSEAHQASALKVMEILEAKTGRRANSFPSEN